MKKQLILMAMSLLIGWQTAADTYYVDAENGNDGWSGTAEVAAADVETSLIGPKKTLAEIMKVARMKNDVVIALPGEYDEKVSNPDAKDQPDKLMRRVIVPAGVTLRSKDGPEVTFIVGESSTDAGATATGCGLNAVGCVENGAGSVVQGFTITGGRTVGSNTYSKESYGAGVCGGIAIGCVISNNACAGRGGAAYNSTLCGCRTYDNKAADCSPVLHNGTAYGCYFADGQSRASTFYNCTFGGDAYPHSSSSYNCLIFGKGSSSNANPKFYRCLKAITRSDDTDEDGTAVMAENSISVDDCGRITKGLDLVKDLGNNDYLSGLSGLPEACMIDCMGGQRVYNRVVDIGGSEIEWRGDFAKSLAKRGVAVEYASAGVTTNAVAGVDISDGDALSVVCTLKTPGRVSFLVSISGEGVATVKRGATELLPEAGVYSFVGEVGESVVTVTFSGTGIATVRDFQLPKFGLLMLFR